MGRWPRWPPPGIAFARPSRPRARRLLIRGGVYCLPETLQLGAEDSGSEAAAVTYSAYENEKPVLMGAKPLSGWTPHKGQIVKTNVNEQGFKGIYFRQLFCDGQRQHLARYPNFDPQNPYGGGWAYADGKPVVMYRRCRARRGRDFTYRPQDERTWSRPDELEVFVFPRYNWWNNIVRVKSVDRAARHITLGGRRLVCHPPAGPLLRPQRAGRTRRAGRVVSRQARWHALLLAACSRHAPP